MQIAEGDIIGAVKIKDGLFIGDELAAQDLEFVVTNKVTHIINCAGKQVPNHWEPIGVIYLTLNWMETDYQVMFDAKDDILSQIYRFIENSNIKGESVLVHSLKGQNRSCCVLAAYFMKKYRWTLYKALEFLHSRKPNLEIRPNFFSQLMNLENKLTKIGQGAKTYNWTEIGDDPKNIESEELLLTNTFLNSKKPNSNDFPESSPKKEYKTRVVISEKNNIQHHPKEKKFNNVFAASDGFQLSKKSSENDVGKTVLKSILKGSDKIFQLKPSPEVSPVLPSSKESNEKGATQTQKARRQTGSSDGNGPGMTRPSSSQGFNIKTNSRPVFSAGGKQMRTQSPIPSEDESAANIQGNIIHITVNNYITNTNIPNETQSAKNNGSNKINFDDKTQLSGSNSSKEFNPNKNVVQEREDNLFGRRGYSPSTGLDRKNGLSSKGFTALPAKKNPQNNIEVDEESIANRNNRFKVTSSVNKTSLAIYGNQNMPKQLGTFSNKKVGMGFTSLSATQPIERELSITGSSNAGGKSMQSDFRTPAYYKYLNPGQGGPVRPTLELKGKDPNHFDNEPTMGYNGLTSQKEKPGLRPMTAPEQKMSNPMKNSPYLATTLSINFSGTRKTRASESAQGQRQGSIQPSKENNLIPPNNKARLRSSSPSQSKNSLFNYFQEMSNKPRWKY